MARGRSARAREARLLPFGRKERSGGDYWIESEGAHGARIRLESRGSLLIWDIHVDADPCEDAALGLTGP